MWRWDFTKYFRTYHSFCYLWFLVVIYSFTKYLLRLKLNIFFFLKYCKVEVLKKIKCEIIKGFTPLWLLLHTLHFGRNSNNTNPHCLVRNSFSATKMKNWLRKFSSDQISGLLPLAIKGKMIVELAKKPEISAYRNLKNSLIMQVSGIMLVF